MDYELHIVVEKVAISSQEVIKRDPIINDALQCLTSCRVKIFELPFLLEVTPPTIARTSACLSPHAHRYSPSLWTVQAPGERRCTGNNSSRLSVRPALLPAPSY